LHVVPPYVLAGLTYRKNRKNRRLNKCEERHQSWLDYTHVTEHEREVTRLRFSASGKFCVYDASLQQGRVLMVNRPSHPCVTRLYTREKRYDVWNAVSKNPVTFTSFLRTLRTAWQEQTLSWYVEYK